MGYMLVSPMILSYYNTVSSITLTDLTKMDPADSCI